MGAGYPEKCPKCNGNGTLWVDGEQNTEFNDTYCKVNMWIHCESCGFDALISGDIEYNERGG